MTVDPKSLTRQYHNGKAAARNGANYTACPFDADRSPELHNAWLKGWEDFCFVDEAVSA